MRATGKAWKTIAAELDIAESTAIYHANRAADRPMPRYRAVVATLTLAGLRVSELCALNCEHVDLARRELRVLDAKTPAGVRRVDIHDDLQEELAAIQGRTRRNVGTRRAGVPERARQALDAQRYRAARHSARSRGGQPAARAGRTPDHSR